MSYSGGHLAVRRARTAGADTAPSRAQGPAAVAASVVGLVMIIFRRKHPVW